jgi:outer membrane protein assembly factor BamB
MVREALSVRRLLLCAVLLASAALPSFSGQAGARAANDPVASFTTSPADPVRRDMVTFTSTSTASAGRTIVSARWKFGDGIPEDTAEGASAQRRLLTTGALRVELNIVDSAGGRAYVVRFIDVADLPQSPLPPVDASVTYQGGPGHDGYVNAPAPAAPLSNLWNRNFDGAVSYAIFAEDKLVVGTARRDGTGSLYALDRETGATLWRRVLGYGLFRATHDDGLLFTSDHKSTVLAIDPDSGETVWAADAGASMPQEQHRLAARDGIVYANGHALDAESGQSLFRAGATLDQNNVYASNGCAAQDRLYGQFAWSVECASPIEDPVVHGRRVYWQAGFGQDGGEMVDAATHQRIGAYQGKGPPVFYGDLRITNRGPGLAAEQASSSAPAWTFSLPGGDNFATPPIVMGTAVAAATAQGRLYMLSALTGQQLWSGPIGFSPGAGAWGDGPSLAAGHGMFVVPGENRLAAFGSGSPLGDPGDGPADTGGGASEQVDDLPEPSDEPGVSRTTGIDATHRGFQNVTTPEPPLAGRWFRDLHGTTSPPAIAEGKVFVARERSWDQPDAVFALDAVSGRTIWERELPPVPGLGHYMPRVAYDNGRVFVMAADGRLRGLNAATGAKVWDVDIHATRDYNDDMPQPVPAGGLVYLGSNDRAKAVSQLTGATVWDASLGNYIGFASTPAVDDTTAYYTGECQNRVAIDRQSGSRSWGDGTWCPWSVPTPVVDEGRLFAPRLSSDPKRGGSVLSAEDGAREDSFAGLAPAIAGDIAVFATGGYYFDEGGNTVYAVDKNTMELLWEIDLPNRRSMPLAPIIVGRHAYVLSYFTVLVIDLETGDVVEQRPLLSYILDSDRIDNEFHGGIAAGSETVAVSGGHWIEGFTTYEHIPGPPDTHIFDGPEAPVDWLAEFSYGSTIPDSTFQCRIDGGAWQVCPRVGRTFEYFDSGTHLFEVRAIDPDGGVDPTPAAQTFVVDTGDPDTTIASGPPAATQERRPAFTFTSSDSGATFECQWSGAGWTGCPAVYTPEKDLADGSHTLRVRAVDPAGNRDPSPATRSFRVDTTPPDSFILAGPAGTSGPRPAFHFSSSEFPAGFQCRLDLGLWTPCAERYTPGVDLPEGAHHLEVRAVDQVGLVDATPAAWDWTVDHEYEEPADDLPVASVRDAAALEGSSGNTSMQVTLALDKAWPTPVVAHWYTGDYSAFAPGDYTAVTDGSATFSPGQTTAAISVSIAGDTADEPNEAFGVALSSVENGVAHPTKPWGAGWIVDDDEPSPEDPPDPPDPPDPDSPFPIQGDPAAPPCSRAISGGPKHDRLDGGDSPERIRGRGGNDRLDGGDGQDCLDGGPGNDRLRGGDGFDDLNGGAGRDRLQARDGEPDVVRCGGARDRAIVDAGDVVKGCEVVRR